MTTGAVPGFRFKEGKLYVFTEKTVMVIHGWPELTAVRKAVDGKTWKSFTPVFRLVRPYRRKVRPKDGPQLALPLDTGSSRPSAPSLADQRKRAFDSFRFSPSGRPPRLEGVDGLPKEPSDGTDRQGAPRHPATAPLTESLLACLRH